jgi:hypothetical protein
MSGHTLAVRTRPMESKKSGDDIASLIARLEVVRVPLSAIHLDPANARLHGERNLSSIVASLKEFGQVEPLVVQRSSGKIIGGNGRYEAMKHIGWTECDVAYVDIDNVKATALGIALNRTAELAEWDRDVLGGLLKTLENEDYDVASIGYTDDELRALIDSADDGEVVEDPEGEWAGMPEYKNEDDKPFRTLTVHFHTEEALARFADFAGQGITEKTKYVNIPYITPENLKKFACIDES